MPNFRLPEFFPEVIDSTFHGPSFASGEGAATREAQIHPGAGGIAPASLSPASFGLGTGPVRVNSLTRHQHGGDYEAVKLPNDSGTYYIRSRSAWSGSHLLYTRVPGSNDYAPTNVFVHFNGTDRPVLENRSSTQAIAPDPQPGSSRASSQTAAGSNANDGDVFEYILKNATIRLNSWAFHKDPIFYIFQDGEKLPVNDRSDVILPNRDVQNRDYVVQQIQTLFRKRGYTTTLHGDNYQTLCLDVTHPPREGGFRVHIKLSSDGVVTLPRNSLVNGPYLLAVVSINPADGVLKDLRIIPVKPGV
jgi:hypothetical protein